MKDVLRIWHGNDSYEFAIAVAVLLGVVLAMVVARYAVARLLTSLARRPEARIGGGPAKAVAATKLWLLLPLAIQAGAAMLDVPARLEHLIQLVAVTGLVLQAGLWATHMTHNWVETRTRSGDGGTLMALALIGFAARVSIWVVVLLFIVNQLGFNITALVAGLGVGGVAIALAVQNILGDLFASLSIILDKPFVVGDFIVVDALRGTVERVGIKTTRVRSLDGELLVFSNSDLMKSRIRNFQRLTERRIQFTIGAVYETAAAKLAEIPAMLRQIVESNPKARFDRAHFKEYGDSALVFEVVYYVLDSDYTVFMDLQQAINLAIFERFAAEGIGFAYPTRTVHVVTA